MERRGLSRALVAEPGGNAPASERLSTQGLTAETHLVRSPSEPVDTEGPPQWLTGRWLRLSTADGAVPGGALVAIEDWLRGRGGGDGDEGIRGLRAREIAAANGARRFEIILEEELGERRLLVASLGASSELRWALRLDRRECRVPVIAWQALTVWALQRGEQLLARQLRRRYQIDLASAQEQGPRTLAGLAESRRRRGARPATTKRRR